MDDQHESAAELMTAWVALDDGFMRLLERADWTPTERQLLVACRASLQETITLVQDMAAAGPIPTWTVSACSKFIPRAMVLERNAQDLIDRFLDPRKRSALPESAELAVESVKDMQDMLTSMRVEAERIVAEEGTEDSGPTTLH